VLQDFECGDHRERGRCRCLREACALCLPQSPCPEPAVWR
jgi:hypothetical protein